MTVHRLLFALCGLVLVGASSRMAAAAPADPMKKTLACLDGAERNGSNAQLCVGAIAAACVKAARNDEPPEAACAAQELAFWQTQMDMSWKALQPLLASFREARAPQLEAQQFWLKYRDKSCAIADKVDPGMMPGGTARCRMEETAARAIALRRLVDTLSEH